MRGVNPKDVEGVKRKMQGPNVKVLSAEQQGEGNESRATFKLQFDDITKLSTSVFFRDLSIKRSDGINGSQVLTAIVRNQKPTELTDQQVERLGPEVRFVTTFPGAVIESNGTTSGSTVTWTWPIRDYFKSTEVMMTAAYSPAAAAGAAEIRQYGMQAAPYGDHPGREYVVNDVRVVEGQPRWTSQNRAVMDDILAEPEDRSVTTIINTRRRFWD